MMKFYISILVILFSFSVFSQNKTDEKFKELVSNAYKLQLVADNDSAKVLFLEALSIKDSPAVNYALGKIYFAENDFYLALKYAEQAYSLNNNNKWFQLFLFNIYVKINDNINAKVFIDKIISLSSATSSDYLLAIDFYSNLNDYNSVINLLNNYTKLFGNNYEVINYYYNALYRLSDTLSFLNVSSDFVNSFAKDDYVVNLTFEFYLMFKLYDQALLLLSSNSIKNDYFSFLVYSEKNDVTNSYNSLKNYLNSLSSSNTDLSFLLDNYTSFIVKSYFDDQLNDLITILLTFSDFDYSISYFIASAYKKLNFFYDAIEFYEYSVTIDPTDFSTFLTLSNLYSKLSMWSKLDSISSIAMDYFPARPYIYLFKGISLLYQNLTDDAYFYLNSAYSFAFYDSTVLSYTFFYLSEFYRLTDDKVSEKSFFLKSQDFANNNYDILLHFAYVYLNNNINLDLSKLIIFNCPNNSSTYFNYLLAFYYYRIHDFDNALITMNNLLSNYNSDNFIYYELIGNIYNKLGNSNKATFYWQLSFEYGNKFINKNL
ncbi:MAG: hypothetical protein JXR68_13785 [Bacteroidales bacterium]|nr:hypothetical protein [Bacteroidales bacterium]